ncbi:MAG: DUF4234 domain-containing protein [Actinomycetota bacterium]
MSTQLSYEQFLVAEVRRRDDTDYRFNYWTYLGWTILTFSYYGHYATYRLVQRRQEHARRRLAFMSYFWHTLNQRAEASGRRAEVAEGLDNLSRIYQQIDAYELRNKREPVLWMILRLVVGFVGAYVNHFLNKDLVFLDEWETSYAQNAEWVMQKLGMNVTVPKRSRPVQNRSTGLYIFLTIITFGIFSMVWRYQTMMDGNGHFDDDAALEDALLRGLGIDPGGAPTWGGSVSPPGTPGIGEPPAPRTDERTGPIIPPTGPLTPP